MSTYGRLAAISSARSAPIPFTEASPSRTNGPGAVPGFERGPRLALVHVRSEDDDPVTPGIRDKGMRRQKPIGWELSSAARNAAG